MRFLLSLYFKGLIYIIYYITQLLKLTWIEALWPEVSGGPLAVVHAADEPARLAVRVVLEDLVVGARVDDDRVHGHGAGDALK